MLTIAAPTPTRLKFIADNLCAEDRAELVAAGRTETVLEIIQDSVSMSYECYVALWNGEPHAVFGIASIEDAGGPWLLTTGKVGLWRKEFHRASKQFLRKWSGLHSTLFNFVSEEHPRACRWLLSLGFRTAEQVTMPSGAPFNLMVLESSV